MATDLSQGDVKPQPTPSETNQEKTTNELHDLKEDDFNSKALQADQLAVLRRTTKLSFFSLLVFVAVVFKYLSYTFLKFAFYHNLHLQQRYLAVKLHKNSNITQLLQNIRLAW